LTALVATRSTKTENAARNPTFLEVYDLRTAMDSRHPAMLHIAETPISSLCSLDQHYVLTGSENGRISLIDQRYMRRAVDTQQDPYVRNISRMEYNAESGAVAVSGFGDFSVWTLNKFNGLTGNTGSQSNNSSPLGLSGSGRSSPQSHTGSPSQSMHQADVVTKPNFMVNLWSHSHQASSPLLNNSSIFNATFFDSDQILVTDSSANIRLYRQGFNRDIMSSTDSTDILQQGMIDEACRA